MNKTLKTNPGEFTAQIELVFQSLIKTLADAERIRIYDGMGYEDRPLPQKEEICKVYDSDLLDWLKRFHARPGSELYRLMNKSLGFIDDFGHLMRLIGRSSEVKVTGYDISEMWIKRAVNSDDPQTEILQGGKISCFV